MDLIERDEDDEDVVVSEEDDRTAANNTSKARDTESNGNVNAEEKIGDMHEMKLIWIWSAVTMMKSLHQH